MTDIGRIIEGLKDRRHERREAGKTRLRMVNDPRAVGPLIALFRDQDRRADFVRDDVARTLVRIGEPAAGPLVETLCDEAHERFHRATMDALTEIGSSAVPALAHCLTGGGAPAATRRKIVRVLSRIADPEVYSLLVHALHDKDSFVSTTTRKLLINSGAAAISPLIDALEEAETDRAEVLADMLAAIARRDAAPELRRALRRLRRLAAAWPGNWVYHTAIQRIERATDATKDVPIAASGVSAPATEDLPIAAPPELGDVEGLPLPVSPRTFPTAETDASDSGMPSRRMEAGCGSSWRGRLHRFLRRLRGAGDG